MIIGIGNDIVDIRRIEKVLDRYGERFIHRIFTRTEQTRSESQKKRASSYARRFAAKEACAKALGTGISEGIWWQDLEVVNLPSGKPAIRLNGRAQSLLEQILPARSSAAIHLTITDDGPWAQAMVIIEALPTKQGMKNICAKKQSAIK